MVVPCALKAIKAGAFAMSSLGALSAAVALRPGGELQGRRPAFGDALMHPFSMHPFSEHYAGVLGAAPANCAMRTGGPIVVFHAGILSSTSGCAYPACSAALDGHLVMVNATLQLLPRDVD